MVCLQGDITEEPTAESVLAHLQGERADLVVCDGAPDVTGMHDLDEYIQAQLLLAALAITTALLRPGGTFVAKIFRGKDVTLLYDQLKAFFPEVYVAKPKSSRTSSVEAFVVGRGFAPPPGFDAAALMAVAAGDAATADAGRLLVPFVACGDLGGYDDATGGAASTGG